MQITTLENQEDNYYENNYENSGDIAHDNSHFRHDGKIVRGLFENDGINVTLREGIDFIHKKNEIIIINNQYKWSEISLIEK